jgi:hypothetical protein
VLTFSDTHTKVRANLSIEQYYRGGDVLGARTTEGV